MMNVKGFILQSLTPWAMAALISGCTIPFFSGYGANSQSREDFEHHVEEVFRLQNQLTSEVMMLLESDESPKNDDLMRAEQRMQQVCADLIEYASRDIDGLSSDIFLSQRVEASAIDCERAALELKPLLKH